MRISDWSSDVCSSDLPGAKDAKDAAAADRALKLIESVKAIVDHINHRLAALFARFLKLPRHFIQAVMGAGEHGRKVDRVGHAYAWNKHVPDGTIRHLFFKRGHLIAHPGARFLPSCRVNTLRCQRAIEIAALVMQRLQDRKVTRLNSRNY